MKRMKIYVAFIMVIGLLVTSCNKEDDSPRVTQIFNLETLTGVELSIGGNVTIVEGVTQKIEVTGPMETVDKILKTVNGGIWNIDLPNGYDKNYKDLYITITSDIIEKLIISGSGIISGEDTLHLSSLKISGSGNIDVLTESTMLSSIVSGSGNMTISGTADLLKHSITGSGNFKGFGLKASDAEVKISGSGNIETYTTNNLDVIISGSGNIFYKGTPVITKKITGSGEVFNTN